VAGPEAAREALLRLGARPKAARHLERNTLFDDAAGRLAAQGRILRLRREPGRALVTFKGAHAIEDGVKSREEIELEVSDAAAFERVAAGLGLVPVFRYEKYRASYDAGDAEIVLDETPIGTFLEIEGPPAAIHRIAAALGRSREDYVLDSYPALFRAGGGQGDMLFPPGAASS
jgi:adenylate cyclase, class 2